jgi:biopolymer transport protein ExbD
MLDQHGNFTALVIIIITFERANCMSIDDNINESENQTPAEEVSQAAPAEPVVEPAATAKSNESVAAAQQAASNLLTTILALKESNPKVFFGGVGAVVLVLLIMFMSGGSGTLPSHQAKAMVPGQNYVLKNPNSYDPSATIRLVAVPGSMAAYDDTEENDREAACKHMTQGTPVKLVQTQNDSSDKNVVWVEVEITAAGECQGKKAWTSAINLQ